jgi:predicted DNA-binding transcriptional regulator YafY
MQRAFALYAALVDKTYPISRDLIEQRIYRRNTGRGVTEETATAKKAPEKNERNRDWFLQTFKRDRALLAELGIHIRFIDDARGQGYLLDRKSSFARADFVFEMDEAAVASLYLALTSFLNEPLFPLPQDLRLAQLRLAQLWTSIYGDDDVIALSNRSYDETAVQQAHYAELLLLAILNEAKVQLTYRNQAGGRSERTLSPYGLTFFEDRWYVVGHDSLTDAQRTFALSRIEDASTLKELFEHPADFRISDHVSLPFALPGRGAQGKTSLIIDPTKNAQIGTLTRGKGSLQTQDDGSSLWTIEYNNLDALARYVLEHGLRFADARSLEADYLCKKLGGLVALHTSR